MTSVSHKARRVAQASAQEPKPGGIGTKCPGCGNYARLENGACVTCSTGRPRRHDAQDAIRGPIRSNVQGHEAGAERGRKGQN